MIVIERMIQHIYPGKWPELEEINKKSNVVEARLGFPAKKRYQLITGGHPASTLIIERQWPSLAAFEATYEKSLADPEYQAITEACVPVVKNMFWEMLSPMP